MTTRIIVGNAPEVLPEVEKNSVHCSVTSPPYYGLRKYAGEQQCDWPEIEYAPMSGLPPICVEAMTCALGHEPTIEAYVGHLVAIYREVRRVLRDDGVAWVVMGDSYATSPPGHKPSWSTSGLHGAATSKQYQETLNNSVQTVVDKLVGIEQGNLFLVPHRLALALQADGWTVRNDNVWAKLAPMPESVAGWRWQRHRVKVKSGRYDSEEKQAVNPTGAGFNQRWKGEDGWAAQWIDCPGCPKCEATGGYVLRKGSWRHTRAHEFVFQLTKKMGYFAAGDIVREGVGVSGVIQRPYLQDEFIHLLNYFGPEDESTIGAWPPFGIPRTSLSEVSLLFARTVLNLLESEDDISLGTFDQKVWVKLAQYLGDLFSTDAPAIHFLATLCTAHAVGEMSTKEFMEKTQRLWINHGDMKLSQESGTMSLFLKAAEVNTDGDATLSINYSSRIRQFLFMVHNQEYTTGTSVLSNSGRNPRSVLTPSPEPYSGAHFAVFPSGLIEPLIKATCPTRCCPECGTGWSPVVERHKADITKPRPFSKPGCEDDRNDVGRIYEETSSSILGYRPSCDCGRDDHVPGVVLDPFFGAGTTGLVADRLGVDCIGIDISKSYAVELAAPRIRADAPLLARVEVI